jgi:hypothetical protein
MIPQSPKCQAHSYSPCPPQNHYSQMGLNSPSTPLHASTIHPSPKRNQTLPRRRTYKSPLHLPRLLSRRHSPPVPLAQNPSALARSPQPQRAPPLPPSTMATQISKKKKVHQLLLTLSPPPVPLCFDGSDRCDCVRSSSAMVCSTRS